VSLAGAWAWPLRPAPRRLLPLAVLALALLLPPGPAAAFGADGHRIVAALAQRQLAPAVVDQVSRLLAGEADPSLVGIATWADQVRDLEAWRSTAPWHYVNFPRGHCRYRARARCPGGDCVVGAIERQAAILADPGQSVAARRQALKFVVHFVADVHQPLHAGYADDRGGNTYQVFYLGQGGNLHALWDGGILRAAGLAWPDHVERLAQRPTPPAVGEWSPQAAGQWAEQSCRLIDQAAVYPPRPGRLPRDYLPRQLPVVEAQLVLAAARLAALLNAVLGDPPG
jgi:hypothetical protein